MRPLNLHKFSFPLLCSVSLSSAVRRPAIFAAVLAAACSSSCTDQFSPAVGPNADVSLFTTWSRRSTPLRPLIDSLEREVVTTQRERAFDVEVIAPSLFRSYRAMKNLVFVASLDSDRALFDVIETFAGDDVIEEFRRGERPYAIYSDVFAVGQTIIVIAAPDRERLADAVSTYAPALYDSLEARVRSGLGRLLYIRGENAIGTDYVNRTRPWSVRIPKDYEVEEDPVRDLILVHTIAPERWLFVQSLPAPDGELTAEAVVFARRGQPRIYADERILDDDLRSRPATIGGRDAVYVEGRWQSDSYVVGGPFGMYGFIEDGRLYLVDYLVFLPGKDKYPYLRQLDVIANTIEFDR